MSVVTPSLNRANDVRLERARLKRMLAAGTLTLAEALEEPMLQTMLVFDLLLALPTRDRSKVLIQKRATLLATCLFAHIARGPLVRVEQLTDREKAVLRYAWWSYQEARL